MRKIITSLFLAVILTVNILNAQQTLEVKSNCVENGIGKILVVTPDDYETNRDERFATIYLLHGYSDNEQKWFREKPELKTLATKYRLIIVCPDGKFSWYWNSVKNPERKYETYVSKDLVKFIDSNFRTKASPIYRAITGLSMGGHGGLWLGLRHPDVFGACGSMSGGVDIRPFPKKWSMAKELGDYNDNKEVWEKHTVINLVENLVPNKSKIIIDCGIDDIFYEVNKNLHQKLLKYKIPHDYTERPGGHTWGYWKNSIEYQLLFFHRNFLLAEKK